MSRPHAGSGTERSTEPSWHEPLASFTPSHGTALRDAVNEDIRAALIDAGEFPSPARYARAVDPVHDAMLAQEIVVQAFELAPRAVSDLAEAWKRDHPNWTAAIDRARAAMSLLEAIDEPEQRLDPASPPRVGAPMGDGRGRYELIERIGAGSSGTVFRAVDHVLSQYGAPVHVAIKIVACAADEADARLREAGAARAVSHAAIARVLDAGLVTEDGALRCAGAHAAVFIASEFIAGVPLYLWKAMHPGRSADECARIALAIADALDHCHANGVAHGDISPANVLVDAAGAPRVVDFGRASWHASGAEGPMQSDPMSRDRRRVVELMRWLVRGLPQGRSARRAVDDVERRCAGRRPRWAIGPRAAAAIAAACVGGATMLIAFAMNAARPIEPVAALFGNALERRPDIAELLRDLLDDGRPTLWPAEVFAAKVRALREEATMARRRGTPARELELAAALSVLATPDWYLARPYAALSVEGEFGAGTEGGMGEGLGDGTPRALRAELAWAIAWSCDFTAAEQPPQEAARIDALAREIAASGLPALLRREGQPAGGGAAGATSRTRASPK